MDDDEHDRRAAFKSSCAALLRASEVSIRNRTGAHPELLSTFLDPLQRRLETRVL